MGIIDVLKIILLGIVEGITEWLPISSTGHLMLVSNIWERFGGKFWSDTFSTGFPEVFDYVVQFGAILAVVVVFFKKIFPIEIKESVSENGELSKRKLGLNKDVLTLWLKVIVACIPAFLAILIDGLFDGLGGVAETIIIASTLIVYGVAFIIVENLNKDKEPKTQSVGEISYFTAFLIGCFQVLAVIPGTSRSGVTIIGALILGVSRVVASEFTFFLAIPTMVGASGFKILKFLLKGGQFTMPEIWALLLGMAVAFIVSMLTIKMLMSFVKKHDFKPFGWYRIALGALLIVLFLCSPKIY